MDLNYPRDVERYKYFVRESTEHGAKLELRTFRWLVETFTKVGDIILDPMAGIGTAFLAATMGRNVVCIELSGRFVEIQRLNIAELNRTLGINGSTVVLQGDCRVYLPIPVDAIIFSPPYGSVQKLQKESDFLKRKHISMGYDAQEANIGNISIYPAYLEAMKEVYRLCLDCVQAGGVLILVTKDYIKARERVFVSSDNVRVAVEVGWTFSDWHRRYTDPKLFQIKSWEKRVEEGTDKAELRITYEDLLVFRKE